MSKKKRKKKRFVRERDWEKAPEEAFTHDRKRHRRTDTQITDAAPIPEIPEDFEPNGLVVSHTKKWAFVQMNDGTVAQCRISDHIIEDRATVLAPGDRVLVEPAGDGKPVVLAIAPRSSKLSRPAGEQDRVAEQVFAANVDVLVIVVSVKKPRFKAGLLDRYLIAAEVGGVRPVICINKMDLVDSEPARLADYRELGLTVIPTSCETGRGLPELRAALRNTLSVFAGQSGVGKTSLLNALAPGLDLATREVSEGTEKGKHTTTASRLYELDGGIRVIDTPGIRALGVWDVTPAEVAFYFPELAEAAAGCKFRDCTHTHEPDCAVLEALETGQIPQHRYDSYLRIREDLEDAEEKYG